MIELPSSLFPDYVVPKEIADYPVHIYTSEEGVEWRTLQSCNASGAKLTLKWEKTTASSCYSGCYPLEGQSSDGTNQLICTVLDFWRLCRGTLIGFRIPDNHPLWGRLSGMVGCYQDVYSPFDSWRFDGKPKIDVDLCGVYDIEVDLIQQPQCR